jgi:hypothetical protein
MKDGKIEEMGSYQELMAAGGEFAVLMRSYGGANHDDDDQSEATTEEAVEVGQDKTKDKLVIEEDSKTTEDKKNAKGRELIKSEDRATGALESSVFVSFAIAMGGWGFVALLCFCLLLTQVRKSASLNMDQWS